MSFWVSDFGFELDPAARRATGGDCRVARQTGSPRPNFCRVRAIAPPWRRQMAGSDGRGSRQGQRPWVGVVRLESWTRRDPRFEPPLWSHGERCAGVTGPIGQRRRIGHSGRSGHGRREGGKGKGEGKAVGRGGVLGPRSLGLSGRKELAVSGVTDLDFAPHRDGEGLASFGARGAGRRFCFVRKGGATTARGRHGVQFYTGVRFDPDPFARFARRPARSYLRGSHRTTPRHQVTRGQFLARDRAGLEVLKQGPMASTLRSRIALRTAGICASAILLASRSSIIRMGRARLTPTPRMATPRKREDFVTC